MKTIPAFGTNVAYFGSNDENVYAIHYYSEESGDDDDANDGDDNVDDTPEPDSSGGGNGDSSLSAGSISGIVIGCVVVVGLVIGGCFWAHFGFCKKKKTKK